MTLTIYKICIHGVHEDIALFWDVASFSVAEVYRCVWAFCYRTTRRTYQKMVIFIHCCDSFRSHGCIRFVCVLSAILPTDFLHRNRAKLSLPLMYFSLMYASLLNDEIVVMYFLS